MLACLDNISHAFLNQPQDQPITFFFDHIPSSTRLTFAPFATVVTSLFDTIDSNLWHHGVHPTTGSTILSPTMGVIARQDGSYALYHYDPSIAAATVFVLLFLATTGFHCWQAIRLRCGIATPLVVGGLSEFEPSTHPSNIAAPLTDAVQWRSSDSSAASCPAENHQTGLWVHTSYRQFCY